MGSNEAFTIERLGNEVFVKFNKKVNEWSAPDSESYQKELKMLIKETFSNADYEIFISENHNSKDYLELVEKTKKEIAEFYKVQIENIQVALYHGNQTLFNFETDREIRTPYLFKGFQIRIYKKANTN